MKRTHSALIVAVFAAASLFLAACGGTTSSASQPAEVKVTLSDFKIESSLTTFHTGVPYHFVVTNAGKVNHEFMIMPPVQPGQMTMTQMGNMALAMVKAEDLLPGTTRTLDVTFRKIARKPQEL